MKRIHNKYRKYQQTYSWNDAMTDVASSFNPYNYNRTKSGDNPLSSFMSGDYEKIPTYYGDDKDKAFSEARTDLGAGKTFLHDGTRYKTDYAGETEHEGTNYFFDSMEKAVADGSKRVTQERLTNFKTLWTELGQPSIELGDDKYDHMLTGQSWDELGLKQTDHVNPLTDKVFIKEYKSKHPGYWMSSVINELTHVKQQRDMGRLSYMGKYVKDLIMSKGDQRELYGTEGTLEHGAHGELYDNMTKFVDTGERTKKHKYGGYINTKNLKRKYQEPSTWDNFEKSKVGKFIDARGLRQEGFDFNKSNTYGQGPNFFEKEPMTWTNQEIMDVALDAGAVFHPGFDFAHAFTKFREGEYTDGSIIFRVWYTPILCWTISKRY